MRTRGTSRRGEITISGTITVGASGAVTSVTGEEAPNITGAAGSAGSVLKDAAAGRYNITLLRKYKNIRFGSPPCILGPTTAAFGNTNANMCQWRPSGSAGQGFTIQALLASTGADTDVLSTNVIHWDIYAQEV